MKIKIQKKMKRPCKDFTHTGTTLDSWEFPDESGQAPRFIGADYLTIKIKL